MTSETGKASAELSSRTFPRAVTIFIVTAFLFSTERSVVAEPAPPSPALQNLTVLRQRFRTELLGQIDLQEREELSTDAKKKQIQQIRSSLTALQPDGSWKDLNYTANVSTNWGPIVHIARILSAVQAWSYPKSPFFHDPQILAMSRKALDFWLNHDYVSYNWWNNEIGIPLRLYPLLILAPEQWTDAQKQKVLEILARANLDETHQKKTGQNLIWYAEIVIARATLKDDVAAARKAFARIEKEITRDQPEGIQWDNSFFQHGEVFQSAAYGLDFSMSIPRLMRIAVGTDFQFSKNSVEVLGNFILDGQRWLVRRQAIEISAMGRTYSRQGKNAIPIMRACRLMVDVPSTRQEEFRSCAESIRLSTPMPIHGNRSFW
ncbi:MAG: hypothetical protein H7222_00340, partial [Methylotenera sp.]|nr:hypothetical protein [Oligoflexia bacterium]